MPTENTTIVNVNRLERALNSRNGSPRWYMHTSKGIYHTAPDSDFNWSLDNHRYPQRGVTLVLNGWGKVAEVFLNDGRRA